jgi:mercuric ion binding protein
MKQFSFIPYLVFVSLFVLIFQSEGKTQNKEKKKKYVTETFWVNSDCDMCKTRIEKACDLKGIRSAIYEKDKFLLTVVYRPDKISLINIHKAIALIGYDTSMQEASEEAYLALPDCCQYDRTKK